MSTSWASIMYAFLGLPLLVIVLFNVLGRKISKPVGNSVGLLVCIIQMASAVICALLLLQYNKESIQFSQFWDMTASDNAAYFSVDFLSVLALFCIGLVGAVAFATATTTVRRKRFNYANMMMILLLGLNGMALVSDLFSLYLFLEISGIASFLLVALYRDSAGLEGGFKYLIMSSVATVFLLFSLAFLFMEFGSLRYVDLAYSLQNHVASDPVFINCALVFLIAAFAIKSGLIPFHNWLPDAHAGSPSSVSVMLSGIVAQMCGTYPLMRMVGFIGSSYPVFNTSLIILAMISIILGAVAAIGQTNFKRMLAYSSISQIGYIVLGAATGSTIGMIGACMHFFNHSVFKSNLFVNAAAVKTLTNTTEFSELGGLQKKMPIANITSIIAGLSNAGIPPLGGFWSKLLIVIAVWQRTGASIAIITLVASLFTCAYFLNMQRKVFMGQEGPEVEGKERIDGPAVAAIALSLITIVSGVLFPLLLHVLELAGVL